MEARVRAVELGRLSEWGQPRSHVGPKPEAPLPARGLRESKSHALGSWLRASPRTAVTACHMPRGVAQNSRGLLSLGSGASKSEVRVSPRPPTLMVKEAPGERILPFLSPLASRGCQEPWALPALQTAPPPLPSLCVCLHSSRVSVCLHSSRVGRGTPHSRLTSAW